MEKKEIRELIKNKRLAMTADEVKTNSKAIADKVFETDEYKKAKLLLVYISCKNEVDTTYIIQQAWKDKKLVAAPVVKNNEMHFIIFDSFDELVSGAFGILEPTGNQDVEELCTSGARNIQGITEQISQEEQLMLMPGVAFDRQLNRIGQGGGYYDRYLSCNRVKTMAVAYEAQIVDSVPTEAHDIRPDIIVTEKLIIV